MARNILSKRVTKKSGESTAKSEIARKADIAIDKIGDAFDNSAFFTWLSVYPRIDSKTNNGIFITLFSKLKKGLKAIKFFITKVIEESKIIDAAASMMRGFLCADLLSWGIGFLIAGLVTSVGKLIANGDLIKLLSINSNGIFFGVILLFIGTALITSRDSVGRAVCESSVLRFIFIRLFKVPEDILLSCTPQKQYVAFAVLGLLLGLCNLYFPFWMPAAVLSTFFGIAILFSQPEIGIMTLITVLPFVETKVAVVLAFVTVAAFSIKVVRGKRIIKVGLIDIAIILFSVALVVFGISNTVGIYESLLKVLLYLLFICIYFTIANSMSSQNWLDSIDALVLCGGMLVSAIAILQYALGYATNVEWIDVSMFSDILTRATATFGNPNVLGQYLILLIPMALSYVATRRKKMGRLGFIAAVMMILALVFTFSRGAWLGVMIAVAIFVVIYNKRVLKALPLFAVAIPLIVFLIPDVIVERFASIGNVADGSTAYRLNIWEGVLEMIKAHWITGVGFGESAFEHTYQMYAIGNTVTAQHAHSLYLQILSTLGVVGFAAFIGIVISLIRLVLDGFFGMYKCKSGTILLGYGAGIVAFLICGMTDLVWYNNRVALFFWIIIGLMVSRSRTYNREWNEIERGD